LSRVGVDKAVLVGEANECTLEHASLFAPLVILRVVALIRNDFRDAGPFIEKCTVGVLLVALLEVSLSY